jgi:hypothetical protein
MSAGVRRLAAILATAVAGGCGGGAASSTLSPSSTASIGSGPSLASTYRAAQWSSGAHVSFSGTCSMTLTTSGGVHETASFIDACSSHPTPLTGGYDWHHHGLPTCLVNQIDGSSGPSHLIGIALDGYPIYGGRDINGNTIAVSQLDACNGITSPTPEFPNGAYHDVLPIGVTSGRSSLNCFAGSVSQSQLAMATKYICGLDALNKRLQAAARTRRLRIASMHPSSSSRA